MTNAFENLSISHVFLSGVTYNILKRSLDANPYLVAYDGRRYVVIAASLTMYVVLVVKEMGKENRNYAGQRGIERVVELADHIVTRLCKEKY